MFRVKDLTVRIQSLANNHTKELLHWAQMYAKLSHMKNKLQWTHKGVSTKKRKKTQQGVMKQKRV